MTHFIYAAVVSGFVATICLLSAFYLYRHAVFNQENIIFDTDPYYRSYAFSEGWGERHLIHPNLSNFVNPVVRATSMAIRPLFPALKPMELRMRVALCVVPILTALTMFTLFVIASAANVSLAKALGLTILYGFSMSTLALGSVPDHVLISAFILSAAVLLFQFNSSLSDRNSFWSWTLATSAAAGITLSNGIPMTALFIFGEYIKHKSWMAALRSGVKLGCAALALTGLLWAALNWVYGDFSTLSKGQSYDKNIARLNNLTDNPLRDFLAFPVILGRAFWGGQPGVDENAPYPKPEIARYRIAFNYSPPLSVLGLYTAIQLIPIFLIGYSVFLAMKVPLDESVRILAPVIVFIGFNWIFHSFWGGRGEIFLFSPHWHFASVLGLVPLLRVYSSRMFSWIFVTAVGATVLLNLAVWYDLLMILPSFALS